MKNKAILKCIDTMLASEFAFENVLANIPFLDLAALCLPFKDVSLKRSAIALLTTVCVQELLDEEGPDIVID